MNMIINKGKAKGWDVVCGCEQIKMLNNNFSKDSNTNVHFTMLSCQYVMTYI